MSRPIKDFTLSKYRELLTSLRGYDGVILRHDVDKKPQNSLEMARLEASLKRKSIYYFRTKKSILNKAIIEEIASLGHEIGYHYESLTTCNGNVDAAWKDFQKNLEKIRSIAPVSKACMHGSPRSKWDSRDIWKKYDYRSVGIDFEPYLDTDFSKTFYLTDTGRRWDGSKYSVRDKIPEYQEIWEKQGLSFSTTDEIIFAARAHTLPESVMITTHPQRWTDKNGEWLWEWFTQKIKNRIKRRRLNKAVEIAEPDFGATDVADGQNAEAAEAVVYSAELDFDTTNGAKTADAVESSAEAAGKQYEDPAESQQEAAESSAEAVTEPDAGAEENAIGQNAEAESDYGYAGEEPAEEEEEFTLFS